MPGTTSNQKLKDWVEHWAGVLQPDSIEWCDGSDEEWSRLTSRLVEGGTFTELDDAKRAGGELRSVLRADRARFQASVSRVLDLRAGIRE